MTEQSVSAIPGPGGFTPIDEAVRYDISHNLDATLFVEASAGTGKTSSLVDRIVNLVASGRATLDRIAAITFTEAAAAELRERVRQRLEEAASAAERATEERERCRQGVADLDQATVCTLHSFAAQLLHERPLEAGLPLGFDTSDEIVAGIKFDEAWNGWLDAVLVEDSPLYAHLALALTLNVTLDHLKGLAREFHANYADLEGSTFAAAEPPEVKAVATLRERWPEAERLCQFSKNGAGDPLYDHVQSRSAPVARLLANQPSGFSYHRQLNRLLSLSCRRGSQGNWQVDPISGRNACTALKDLLAELHEAATADLAQARQFALAHILNSLKGFVFDYARQRKSEGRAEFHDLLVWARDMLRDNLEVRDYFRQRFSHLLIDESQDTDPIQGEIAMFLAEATPENPAGGERPTSWEQVLPEKGRLFVVGDPKQSIYRFRRADVEQMRQLQKSMELAGGRSVSLTQNFRSQQPIVAWVNHLFQNWMGEGDSQADDAYLQPAYADMEHRWGAATDSRFGPRVWALAEEETPGSMEAVRRLEAADIATLLRQIVGQQWQKLNREATDDSGEETYQPVSYSDICILIRSRTSLHILERALEAGDIPYRLESASLIFETQEVRDLLNCLRAIDNPADRIAVVAALRSPAFGCSDVDLLRHYESGGQFDYLTLPGNRPESVVSEALAVLRGFHQDRLWEAPAVLIERFIRDRLLLEAATFQPRMREQWRRYRFMVEQAGQFSQAGGNSLRAFVEWIHDQISEGARVTEAPVPESDEEAVRVMTIHAAKGLEFPVVILTGINSRPRGSNAPAALFDRQRGTAEARLGSGNSAFTTPGYETLKDREDQMSEAELVRLMYVATTRARDHLVLSLRRSSNSRNGKSPAHAIVGHLESRPDLWQPVVLQDALRQEEPTTDEADAAAEAVAAPEHSLEARDEWAQRRKSLIDSRGRPVFTAATSLGLQEREEKPEQEGGQTGEPWRRGRAGTSIGRAVHAVLQSIDLATGEGIADRSRAQAMSEGIPGREGDIAVLARAAVNSAIVRRAVASGRLWREVPVATPVGDGFLHGFIDLLFEERDGLVIVDYKTDSVNINEIGEAMERYRLQGGAYAYAMSRATGKTVKEVQFLYLQPRQEVALTDLAQAMAAAEAQAELQLGRVER